MRFVLVVTVLGLSACATKPPPQPQSTIEIKSTAPAPRSGDVQEGMASWYGAAQQGGPTASGEQFDMRDHTAAHKTLRMHTRVKVTNKLNGKSTIVRINDRGPYAKGRIIDLSRAAAVDLDMLDRGVVPVTVEVLR